MYFLILVLAGVILLFWSILWPHSSLLYPIARKGDRAGRKIAFTFDDGPHPDYTPVVLEAFHEAGIKATFFCLARNVEAYPDLAAQIHEQGHLLASHSYDHSFRFYFYGPQRTFDSILHSGQIIGKITGFFPRFYRPPVGIKTPPQCMAAGNLSLRMIGWSRRAFDGSQGRLTLKKTEKLVRTIRGGDIVLLHDGRITPGGGHLVLPGYQEEMRQSLRHLLEQVEKAGWIPVRVDELLEEDAFLPPPNAKLREASGIRAFFKSLIQENSDPKKLSLSVAAGVFVGCSPLYGVHSILGLILAVRLQLNKIAVLSGTHISNPLLAPFLVYACVQVGWFLQHGTWLNWKYGGASMEYLQIADRLFFSWSVGFLVVGTLLSILSGAITFAVLSIRRGSRTIARP